MSELPDDVQLLQELATIDEVEAYIPTCKDGDEGYVPTWCELVLAIQRDGGDYPIRARWALRRHDGELIIEVLRTVLHPDAGGGTGDALWRELDAVHDRIMSRVNAGEKPFRVDVGMARGLVRSIAIVCSTGEPDEDAIREVAAERYAIRNGLIDE